MFAVTVSTPLAKFIFWVYLLFLVVVFGTVTNPADPDLWHRLAFGEYACRTGHFPTGDTFSYLADYQQVADHEWGSALILYGLWQWAGPGAIVVTKLVTLALTLSLVIWAGIGNRRPTTPMAGFYALILLTLLPSFQSTVRCMVFTHILFALWIWWYQRERQGLPILTAWYVVTMALWANLHGGFVIGLLWLALVTVVEAVCRGDWKKWARRLGLCSLATLINPFGWGLWVSTGRALVVPRQGFGEWAPVAWLGPPILYLGFKLLVPCVVAALAIQLYRKGRPGIDQRGVILVITFMALALMSARHTSLFAVVAGALLPDIFPLRWPYVMGRGRCGAWAPSRSTPRSSWCRSFHRSWSCPARRWNSNILPSRAPSTPSISSCGRTSKAIFSSPSTTAATPSGSCVAGCASPWTAATTSSTSPKPTGASTIFRRPPRLVQPPHPPRARCRPRPRGADIYPKIHSDPGWKEAYRDPYDAVFLPR